MRWSPAQLAFPAALLTAIVPGFGHFLIRAWSRGATWFAGWLVLGAISGVTHSPVVLVLVAVTAIDAYLMARSQPEPPGAVGPSDPRAVEILHDRYARGEMSAVEYVERLRNLQSSGASGERR